MKRFRAIPIALSIVLVFCVIGRITADASALRASPTLNAYNAIMAKGSSAGKVVIAYDIAANTLAESLGVSSIVIYKSNGNYVTTIYPTSLNGLKTTNAMWHRSSYTYTGTSGTSYYAKVTVFATIDGVTDSRTITTNTVTAP